MGMLNIQATDPIGNAFRAFSDVNNSLTAARESENRMARESLADQRAQESHDVQMKVNNLALDKASQAQADEDSQRELVALQTKLSAAKEITPELADEVRTVIAKNKRLAGYSNPEFRSERSKIVEQFSGEMGNYLRTMTDPEYAQADPDAQQRLMDTASKLYADEINTSRKHDYQFSGFTRPIPVEGQPGSFYLAANWTNKKTGQTHEAPFTTGAGTEPTAPVKVFTVGQFADRVSKEKDLIGALEYLDSMRAAVGDKAAIARNDNRQELGKLTPDEIKEAFGNKAEAFLNIAAKTGLPAADVIKMMETSKEKQDALMAKLVEAQQARKEKIDADLIRTRENNETRKEIAGMVAASRGGSGGKTYSKIEEIKALTDNGMPREDAIATVYGLAKQGSALTAKYYGILAKENAMKSEGEIKSEDELMDIAVSMANREKIKASGDRIQGDASKHMPLPRTGMAPSPSPAIVNKTVQPAATPKALTAINPQTKQRIVSYDNGRSWQPATK